MVSRSRKHVLEEDLERLRAGEVSAFNLFYKEYAKEIEDYIRMFLKANILTQDVKQEVFLKFWENHAKFQSLDMIRGFLYLTAKNHSINILRRSVVDEQIVKTIYQGYEYEKAADTYIMGKEYREYIQEVLRRVPEQSRKIFKLCKIEGKSYEEVGEELQISRNTVKKHMVRTLSVLRNDEMLKGLSENMVLFYCFWYFFE